MQKRTYRIIQKVLENQNLKGNRKSNNGPNITRVPFQPYKHSIISLSQRSHKIALAHPNKPKKTVTLS